MPMKKITVRKKRQGEIADLMNPHAQKKFQRDADNALIDMEEQIDVRFEYAKRILKMQNEAVHKIVSEWIEQMQRMAGEPVFLFNGMRIPGDPEKMREMQEKNFVWIAVRLLAACAVWDIQISGFKLPEDACAKCGKEVKIPKKKRR